MQKKLYLIYLDISIEYDRQSPWKLFIKWKELGINMEIIRCVINRVNERRKCLELKQWEPALGDFTTGVL